MQQRILLLATLAPGAGAQASTARRAGGEVDVGVRHVSLNGKDLRLQKQQARRLVRQAAQSTSQGLSAVGDEKFWLAVDFIDGSVYLKAYTLRAVGNNIEVWVASDSDDTSTGTDFPDGDCRNGLRTEITDDQVNYLIDQFDNNILPKESDVFSVAPPLDGSNALLPALIDDPDVMPPDYFEGDGNNTVVLVDNVRDENFFDTNNQNTFSYVAGFFADVYGIYFDRNVMTIDAWDWLHRTGANPPHEPTADPMHQRAGPPVPLRGRVRSRVSAPARVLRGSRRDHLGERRIVRLDHGLRADYVDRSLPITRARVRQSHAVLPRLARGGDRRQSAPGYRRSGAIPEPVG